MRPVAPLLLVTLLALAGSSLAQSKVDTSGITARVKLEEVLTGYLPELNGKFKVRATEVTFAPGGDLGVHHHIGPGIRYVVSGRVTFVQAGKATVYQAGDYFYESGNVAHTAHNKTNAPLRVIFFEILPADWTGPTTIPPKAL
jgi:quercetin dioxygenase-like cupin family protein